MRRLIVFAALLGLMVAGHSDQTTSYAQNRTTNSKSPSSSQFSALMRLKLEKAKGLLEGLSLEDHALIAKSAHEMRLLSLESGWNVIQTKEYADQSRDFRRACDSIIDAAENEDIGRAALAYVSLTVRCVECHSYVRKQPK